jgi:hypothetical protein
MFGRGALEKSGYQVSTSWYSTFQKVSIRQFSDASHPAVFYVLFKKIGF